MKKLSGKNAFISGSSRGIGLACAKALAEQGANVFLVATNEVLLKEATSEIQQRSAVQVGFHAVDLSTLEGCLQASHAFLERLGQANILVNSAGDWGPSKPTAVPDLILEMRRREHSEELIRKVVYDNPIEIFSQSENFNFRPRD